MNLFNFLQVFVREQMTAIQNHFCLRNVNVNDVTLFLALKPPTENVNIRHLVCEQKRKQRLVPVELFVKRKRKQFLCLA